MKRGLSLLMLLALLSVSLGAAAEALPTIQDIMDANTLKALLSRHESVALQQEADEMLSASWANQSLRYAITIQGSGVNQTHYEQLMTAEDTLMVYYIAMAGEEYPLYDYTIDVGLTWPHVYTPETEHTSDFLFDPVATAYETVESAEAQPDGTLKIITRVSAEDLVKIDDGYPEGTSYRREYYVDPDTLEISRTLDIVVSPEGQEHILAEQTVLYDLPKIDDIETLEYALSYYHAPTEGDVRTVTFVLEPGTPRARAFSTTGAQGFLVSFWAGDADYAVFQDPACTVPTDMSELIQDATYYIQLQNVNDET